MFSFKHMKVIPLLLLFSLLLPSCNDGTLNTPSSPEGSPSVSESSSPAPTEETPTPTPDNYTDLPVIECTHGEAEEHSIWASQAKGFSKGDLFRFDFTDEDGAAIAKILNEGKWVKGEIDFDGQWYLCMYEKAPISGQRLQYNEQGVFFNYVYGKNDRKHLILTDRQRDTVNSILSKYEEQSTPLPDPADAQAVLAYIGEKSDENSLLLSSRTDFADPTAMDKISLDTPYESLKDLIGTYHFVLTTTSKASGNWNYPCYAEFFVLSDGRLLELKIETDKNEWGRIASRTIIGKRLLSITDFDKEYLTRITDETDEEVALLSKAMPLLSNLHTLADTPFANDQLGYTADLSRNDALDPALIDQIEKGMHAPEVYDILGSPHVSYREHSNQLNCSIVWYALSDGRILEITYLKVSNENEQQTLRSELGLSDKGVVYTVDSTTVYNESELLDLYIYTLVFWWWYQ